MEVNHYDTSEAIMKDHNSLVFLYFPKEYTKNLKYYIGNDHTNYDFNSTMYMNINNYSMLNALQIQTVL